MSDDLIPTMVDTNEGEMPFQEYFVKRQCHPQVRGFRFDGVEDARPAPGVAEAIKESDLVVICPSNPWVSIDPILAVPGVRLALGDRQIVGVSPIIGGQAVKGPAAKMYQELGFQASAHSVAQHYKDLLKGFLIDDMDKELVDEIQSLGIRVLVTNIFMNTIDDRIRLARELLMFSDKYIQGRGENSI
jgi:LPPG:FO 2-phospho-L-lactate transferase